MDRVVNAFVRALASQLHPKMLALLLVPFVVAVVFWGVLALLAWAPLLDWLRSALFEGGGVAAWIVGRVEGLGFDGFGELLTVVLALMLVAPLMFVTALAIIAVFSMPAVNRHLGNGAYRDVARRGSWSVAASVWNALAGMAIFMAGYLLTLPLWLVPPLAFFVPWLWWGWLTARLMRFDSLVEHADPRERKAVIARHRSRYFLLGMMVTALNYIPPLFLITPVLSALAFAHYSLAVLREERAAAGGGVLPLEGRAGR